ncbi:MAG: phosphate ABC transporter ATP-binding protein [Proteobacteria bacterium]|nr:phosphate ABC transporter ATP-binding protein [Pseudomonadota bacterium]
MINCSKETKGSPPICKDGTCLTDASPLIHIRDLSVRFGSQYALQNITAEISPCSITAVIGPSGSGKTTFLSCFNRLIDFLPNCKASGSIRWAGREILDPRLDLRALRTQIGMVFQKPNPFPLSIYKNISLPLKEHRRHHQIEEKIETALRDVGLWDEVKDRLNASALSLSGGQQQRLCIARTLALEPEIILFDEPCSALDPMASALIEDLIHNLRHRFSVLIVTHNLAQARRVADDVAVFWTLDGKGSLIEFGKTEQIFYAPRHYQTAAYITGKAG